MNTIDYINLLLEFEDIVLLIAKSVRNKVIKEHTDLKAMCYEISLELSKELKNRVLILK